FDVGAVAELRTSRDAFLGYVCVNPHALICARILSRDAAQPVDRALIERRLATALVLREKLGRAQYCRWVFGESDLLPGLVLDVCSYVGAWAVAALRHGAARALCVDASEAALELARRNAERNSVALEVLHADAFDALKSLGERGERFEVVILDPPAFIKRKKDTPKGQAAYRKLNQLALGLLADEGLLVSCSCSYHLAAGELVSAIQTAARH